jgi:O-succinylbenzoic acid--CoA ligase
MVNIRERITGPLLLDGKAYSVEDLLAHCREEATFADIPAWRKEALSFIAAFLDPRLPDILQQSSGTTGDPKRFILERDAMLSSARRTLDFFGLKKGERALLCLPVSYIAGKMMVVRALLGGLDLHLQEPSSRPLRYLEGNMSFAAMVPLQIEDSIRHGDSFEKIARLLIGGGELHPNTRMLLGKRSAPELFESFGMTETYTHFALKRINGDRPDTTFRLLEDVHISTDSRDCLVVEITGVTSGKITTNDLVEIHGEGRSFTWLGRFDNLINTGGIKIIPELLEERISSWLGYECLVLPEKDRKLGERLVLMVEFEGEEPPLNAWETLLRERLPSHEVPKKILVVKSLPRNAFMKPDRTSSRDLLL